MRGYVRIDEALPEHPKIAALTDSAFRAYITAIAYSNRNLTDGYLPESIAAVYANESIGELAGGLWEPVDGGYRIHDYLDFQRSKADILELREARKAAGAKGGKASSRAKDKQVLEQNASKPQAEQEQEQEKNKSKNLQPSKSVAIARRDEVWDFVVELSGEPLPGRRAGHGRMTSDLRTLLERSLNGSGPDAYLAELRRRHEALIAEFGEAKATARALVTHWDRAGRMADGLMRPASAPTRQPGMADRLMAHSIQLRQQEMK